MRLRARLRRMSELVEAQVFAHLDEHAFVVPECYGDDATEWFKAVGADVKVICRPNRRHRRGHDINWTDFLPGDDWHCDNGYTPAEFAAAFAAFAAWFHTLAACLARPLSWGAPDDEPAPVRPLLRLTPRQARAPSALPVLGGVPAA